MIDIVVAIIALGALIAIVVIVSRQFPKLAAIDTKAIPTEQHDELKTKLIEQRFKRRLTGFAGTAGKIVRPTAAYLKTFFTTLYRNLLELEKRYRLRAKQATFAAPEARAEKAEIIERVLSEAKNAIASEEFAVAEQKAIEAISVDPRSVAAYRLLATIYLAQKDYEHAHETLMFIIERLKVEDDELYAELGIVATGEGKLDEAKRDFEKSIVINGHVAQHYLDLSQVQLSLGDAVAAFESCRHAVELEPNNPKFLDALVHASIVAGKREWAEETLNKLRTVNPENQKLAELASRVDAMPTTPRRTR